MAQIALQNAWRVDIIESERGWGSKVEDTKYFDNFNEAEAFVKNFNAQNNKSYVPDWYMYATEPARVR